MKTPKTVYALFRQGAKWIKGSYAKTSPRGSDVRWDDPRANCFCLIGALRKIYGLWTPDADNALAKLRAAIGVDMAITAWNDAPKRTFREVLAAVRKAGIAIMVGGLLLLSTSCAPNYSDGERIGIVTKLSQKGLFWKSWEGEMLVALPVDVAGTTQPEKFTFNVSPPAVAKVRAALASGERVTLVYRQWAISPPTIDNDHVVIDVKEGE